MRNRPFRHIAAAETFLTALKRLRRRYPHIGDALKPFMDALQRGETPGDQIQGTSYTVYKVRLPNTDAQRGKSGGFRVIYYIKTSDSILLIYIYSKTDRADMDADEIRRMIEQDPGGH